MIDNIKSNCAYLVVGGDSLVGEGLLYALEERGHRAYSTTRRIDTLNSRRVKLDFEKFEEFIPPSDVDLIFVNEFKLKIHIFKD